MSGRVRIGIDGHMIGDNSGGNESYYTNILKNMIIPEDWDVFLFMKSGVDDTEYRDKFRIIRFHSSNPGVRNFIELPRIAKKLDLNLLHLQYFIPFSRPCPVVVMIHDICFEHYRNIFTRKEYLRQRLLIPYAARKASRVFTVSEFSKKDISEKYGIKSGKIVVTPDAVGKDFKRLMEDELDKDGLRKQFGIGSNPYILTVGNLQPRKNLPRLIGAYKKMREEGRNKNHKLVIVGKKAWMYDEILSSAQDDEVILTDYVSSADLVRLYNAADLFIYPSFFEGFGIPPLEAMACGTPVAASNTTALTEVVGDAGLLFDPFDTDSIKDAMVKLIEDEELRAKLAEKGYEQVRKYSWEKSAQLVVDTYRKVVGASK